MTTPYEPPTEQYAALSDDRVAPEAPRRHPVAYAAAALSALALVLSLVALTSDDGPQVRRVTNGTRDCVAVAQDRGPDLLYCR